MVRLRIEGRPYGLQEILLRPGLNRLGRLADNDFQVTDDSVSSHHCQIELKDGIVTVRDLNSTNGTFIDGKPVQQAVLHPGQVLCLGTVPMICQDDAAGEPVDLTARSSSSAGDGVVPSPASSAGIPVGINTDGCLQHPQAAAQWRCVQCGGAYCTACVRTTRVGAQFFRACPKCGSSCLSVAAYARLMAPVPTNFFALCRGAFSYPLKKDGAILLVCGTAVFGFLDGAHWVLSTVVKHMWILGIPFWFAYFLCLVMGVGYLFAFMQNIVQASSQGEEKMPDWPEISGFWQDLVIPFFRFGVIWFICLSPGIAVQMFVSPMAGVPLLVLGLLCLPMAILTVCLADGINGLNPIIIFSGIGKVPLPYLTICGLFLVIIALMHGSQMLLEMTGIPVLPTVISAFISLYGLTVEMRLLGLLYYTNKAKLAWFE